MTTLPFQELTERLEKELYRLHYTEASVMQYRRMWRRIATLGHVDIATTETYARADTEMKRKALEKAYPEMVTSNLPHWENDEALLTWLASL